MLELPQHDLPHRNANRKLRQLLGRSYLREDRLKEALDIFLELLDDDPQDGGALLVLGNLYRVCGSCQTAARLYERVLMLTPGHALVESLAGQALAGAAEGDAGPEEADPLSRAAFVRLAGRIQREDRPGQRAEIRAAADVLDKYCPDEPLGAVQQLMPALIEMSIRQARASGRTEMAEALQSLQIHFRRQTGSLNPNALNERAEE